MNCRLINGIVRTKEPNVFISLFLAWDEQLSECDQLMKKVLVKIFFQDINRSSCYMAQWDLAVSLERWPTGSIPRLSRWVKDPVLPQLWHRLQLWHGSDPWPGNPICHRAAEKEKKYIYINRKVKTFTCRN